MKKQITQIAIVQVWIARTFIAFSLLFISGCQSVPSSQTLNNYAFLPPQGKATLVLIRPFYIAYGIRGLSIKVNDTPIVTLANQSFTVVHRSPGKQKLESEGGFLSWSKKEKYIDIQEGQVMYVVWYIEDGLQGYANKVFNAQWMVVSKEVAENYLKDASYISSSL